ncbi:unnamed protein product [Arabis nemorensis]|uniref:Uncharacterized protein n=1 Tax=Arabis nemorensis TaxID=586526 RepID=A0A565BQY0_9BRAS|nr:unnamed protein product [Arabis nemorensis]
MSAYEIEYNDDYCRQVAEYWRKVEESGGFDIEGLKGMPGLVSYNCQGLNGLTIPLRPFVILSARLGLQRYNMDKGTNFDLHCLIKFNMVPSPVSTYYITLAARDTVTRRPMQTFQVRVDQNQLGPLDITCSVARIKGETTDNSPFIPMHGTRTVLPDWPSDDDAFNDIQRFSFVEGSELRSAYWIRMYLQLAVCAKYRILIQETDLCNLEIVKVAIETSDGDVNERLKAKNAIFYIAFKGLATNIAFKASATDGVLGKHVVRKAIIKRSVDERTGNLSLLGELDKEEEELNAMTWQEFHKQGLQNRKRMTCARKNKS